MLQMKTVIKVTIILLFFVLIPAELCADKTPELYLGAGNDTFSMGLAKNYDDQKSFSINALLRFNKLEFKLDLDAITNRGWNDGFSIRNKNQKARNTDEYYSGRYDSASLTANYTFDFKIGSNTWLYITPAAGLSITGNLGLNKLQDANHNLFNLPNIDLFYDFEKVFHSANLGLNLETKAQITKIKSSKLFVGPRMEVRWVSNLQLSHSYFAEITLNNSLPLIKLGIGYSKTYSLSTSKTEKLYSQFASGLTVQFLSDAGLFRFSHVSYPLTGFGTSTIMINPIRHFMPSKWHDADLELAMGSDYIDSHHFHSYSFAIPTINNFAIAFKESYTGGYAKKGEEKYYPLIHERINDSYTLFGLKYNYSPKALGSWITLSPSLMLGFAHFDHAQRYNMDPSSLILEDQTQKTYSFVASPLLQLTILPPNFIKGGYTDMRFSFHAGAMFVTNKGITPLWGWNLTFGISL